MGDRREFDESSDVANDMSGDVHGVLGQFGTVHGDVSMIASTHRDPAELARAVEEGLARREAALKAREEARKAHEEALWLEELAATTRRRARWLSAATAWFVAVFLTLLLFQLIPGDIDSSIPMGISWIVGVIASMWRFNTVHKRIGS